MELRDVEYFTVVADRGHVGRAADALGMSQSALSKCLRRIERSVGTKIVVRTAKGIELTAAGSTLLSHVSRLRLAHEDIGREIADLARGTQVTCESASARVSAKTWLARQAAFC